MASVPVAIQEKLGTLNKMMKAIPSKVLLLDDGGSRMDPVTSDGLLIFGFLAVVLAPMALALAETGPGGAGWKLLTFVCCALAAWFIIFPSNLRIALVAWALAWACAMARRMISIDAVPDPRGLRRTSPSCPIY